MMTLAASRGVLAVRTASGDDHQRVRPPRWGRRSFGAPAGGARVCGAATREPAPDAGHDLGQQPGAGPFGRLRCGSRDSVIGALAGPPATKHKSAGQRRFPELSGGRL